MIVKNFRDLMVHGACTIQCLYSGETVRTLTPRGDDDCLLVAGDGTAITIPLDTEITFEPWVFDRGNLIFSLPAEGTLKICGESDWLTAGEETYQIFPA